MQANLVTQLLQVSTFSPKLVSILDTIRKTITNKWPRSLLKQVEHHLISLTCQNKNLLHYRYLEEKANNQRCLANMIEILAAVAKMSKEARETIAGLFVSHVLSHTSCYVSYYTFYLLIEAVPALVAQVPYDSLLEINSKLKRQQNPQNFKTLDSIRIEDTEVFSPENIQLCQKNLDHFLWAQVQPNAPARDKEKSEKSMQMKIPPLLIPTSKSINSSRYSAISREEKRKGLAEFQKLAQSLGEGFIAVELGCLLANKRTRQVQQYSENSQFRDKCLERLDNLDTQRLNSSRLTMHNKTLEMANQEQQQNSKKYYRKVLTINLNIFLKRVPGKLKILQWINRKLQGAGQKRKTETNQQQTDMNYVIMCCNQIIEMSLAGAINLSPEDKSQHGRQNKLYGNNVDIFTKMVKELKTVSEAASEIMARINSESQKLHLNLLINKNKAHSHTHYSFEAGDTVISDQFLQQLKININEPQRIDGNWKDHKKLLLTKKYSDPILLSLGSWFQSLHQLADMSHPMFFFYQINILKTTAFYLISCNSKISNFYFAEYLFRLFMMVKRTILQLSHPLIRGKQFSKAENKLPLTNRYPELMQYLLVILTCLLDGGSKNIERLIANIFIKNVYFMQVIQQYFEFLVKQENVPLIISALNFYKKAFEVYTTLNKKSSHSKQNENSATYFLYQHISEYLCPRGCISRVLTQHETFISPSNLDDYDNEQKSQHSNTQISSGLLKNRKGEQYNIQRYLHQLFMFISHVYYQACPSQSDSLLILDEQICSFYIKYSIMNFVKLYSLLTVNELANIGATSRRNQELDCMPSTKESPHSTPKINTKQIFMIDFLKMMSSISINRTPEIAKKFRQHRVLEFFVREIQLEFSVKQNIEKYIKKAINIRSVSEVIGKKSSLSINNKEQELDANSRRAPDAKKTSVPGLKLTGELFKKSSSQQPKGKQLNTTLNQKVKKMIPALNLPSKTEQSSENSRSRDKTRKGVLDDMIEDIIPKSNKKKSFKEELNLKLDGLTFGNKQKSMLNKSKSSKQDSDANLIYFTQRKIRKIYSNKILHAESILLILSLILYRGQLDPTYCDQMPVIQGKLNVLYILHNHLNHEKNKSVLSILSQSVSRIKPALSGQRLFKLLSNQHTDLSHYYDWNKINAGAFGVIMSAKTHFAEPKEVAIKQMNFPKSIYERCVLNDIFTEITSLEMFRLQDRVTRMYNYGVHDNTYVIVMKKYTCSLRDWRLGSVDAPEAKLFPPTLPNILALFYDVIKGIKLLHEQNVTHYDIKCDNILLEFVPGNDPRQPPKVNVVFADFGVAKIYEDEKDELDLKSRGTQCIKSPEMLTLTLKNKKEADNFDRRKKIGTTKASDIWSLGCLLYEIVTGEFLFNSNDWVHFFMLVTSQNQQILTAQNCQKMKNNIYLIDFIKYILIRDPQHRPSIHSILCRFESLYSLMVANPQRVASSNLREPSSKSLDELIDDYRQFIKDEEKAARKYFLQQNKRLKSEGEFGRTGKVMEFFNPKFSGKITKIMEDMYFCERESQVIQYQKIIRHSGITHIIVEQKSKINKNKFKVIEIETGFNPDISLVYKASPRVSDVLREVLLLKGKLLFVNSQSNFCMNLLIFTLSYWFKCSSYETWCLINTQILEFPPLINTIISLSKANRILLSIEEQVQQYPKLQCICGSVTIVLKKKFQQKRGEVKACKCNKNKAQTSRCFSKNCPGYLQFIRRRYNIVWEHLTWTLVNRSQLMTQVLCCNQKQTISSQVMLNSADPLSNMCGQAGDSDQWNIHQCKVCQMWIMATNGKQNWLILNNLIKSSRQGIMIPNAQQDFKARTPTLNCYTLSKLHMTQ